MLSASIYADSMNDFRYAIFNIRDYALGDGEMIVSLPVFGTIENEQIGLLKVTL